MSLKFRSLCLAAALACTLAPAAAQSAKKVLFLSTAEVPQVGPGGPAIQTYAFNGFQSAAGAANIIDKRGALTNSALTNADFADVDIVVAVSVYNTITAANSALLRNLMATRSDLSFALFLDGCCQQASNLTPMLTFLSSETGWTLTPASHHSSTIYAPLNTQSPYSASFASVNPFQGEAYELVPNVPGGYALYLPHGTTSMPALTTPTSTYGFILPQKSMSAGDGACTLLVSDTSHFTKGTQNVGIANAVLHAARDTSGACRGNTIEPDLTPVMSGPAHLLPGMPQSYSVTVKNVGLSNLPVALAATVAIELPAGMTPLASSLPAGCAWAAPHITCTGLPAIASGASSPAIHFQAVAGAGMTSATLKSVVGGVVPGEVNKANNHAGTGATGSAAANLTLGLATAMAPVPTLHAWGLGALAGVLGLMGARQQRRRRQQQQQPQRAA